MVLIYDNVLSNEDLKDYKSRLTFARFQDIVSQGQKYSDMSQDISGDKLYSFVDQHIGFKTKDVINFLRAYRNKPEYRHPMWIHSDVLFSDFIAIYFVQSSEFPQDDGFALWKNKQLDDIQLYTKDHTGEKNKIIDSQSMDPDKWEMWKRVEFKENRLIICPASYFHSCATYGHHGTTLDKCRIVHVLFFNKEKTNG